MMQSIIHDDSDRLLPMANDPTRGHLLAAADTGGGSRPACHGDPGSVDVSMEDWEMRNSFGGAGCGGGLEAILLRLLACFSLAIC